MDEVTIVHLNAFFGTGYIYRQPGFGVGYTYYSSNTSKFNNGWTSLILN